MKIGSSAPKTQQTQRSSESKAPSAPQEKTSQSSRSETSRSDTFRTSYSRDTYEGGKGRSSGTRGSRGGSRSRDVFDRGQAGSRSQSSSRKQASGRTQAPTRNQPSQRTSGSGGIVPQKNGSQIGEAEPLPKELEPYKKTLDGIASGLADRIKSGELTSYADVHKEAFKLVKDQTDLKGKWLHEAARYATKQAFSAAGGGDWEILG